MAAGKLHHLKGPRVQPIEYRTPLGQKQGILYRQMPIRNIIFCGHVDAGKSTTTGSLLLKSGAVSEQTIAKFQKEAAKMNKTSFAKAWVTDVSAAQRATGKTMDICHVQLFTGNNYWTIIDAPGHSLYQKNMITGAAQADAMALIIDSEALYHRVRQWNTMTPSQRLATPEKDPLSDWSTREHAIVCRGLGVTDGIVILNKIDMFPQAQRAEIFECLRAYLITQLVGCGFNIPPQAFCPISAYLDLGIDNPMPGLETAGCRPLMQVLDTIPLRDTPTTPFRMHIQSILKEVQGTNVVFTGKVQSGTVKPLDVLMVQPSAQKVTVRTIQMHRKPLNVATKGCNVGIDVKGPSGTLDELKDLYGRNSILCDLAGSLKTSKSFTAKVILKQVLATQGLQVDRTKVILHMASGVTIPAKLKKIQDPFDMVQRKAIVPDAGHTPGTPVNVDVIAGATRANITFQTDTKVPLDSAADHPRNGHFLIRQGNKTLGWGVITQVHLE